MNISEQDLFLIEKKHQGNLSAEEEELYAKKLKQDPNFALFEEEFVLVRHETEAQDPVPSPDSLQKMRLLLLEEGHCFRDQALAFCALDGRKMRDVMEGSSLSTLV